MAFLDLMRQFFNAVHHQAEEPGVVEEALELREKLAEDPNDIAAFEELASLITSFAHTRVPMTHSRATPGQLIRTWCCGHW